MNSGMIGLQIDFGLSAVIHICVRAQFTIYHNLSQILPFWTPGQEQDMRHFLWGDFSMNPLDHTWSQNQFGNPLGSFDAEYMTGPKRPRHLSSIKISRILITTIYILSKL